MTNKEILEKAIKKAILGGWDEHDRCIYKVFGGTLEVKFENEDSVGVYSMLDIIFNHDFAKALWKPEYDYELICSKCNATYNWWGRIETKKYGFPPSKFCGADGSGLKKVAGKTYETYRRHLQQMVVADDPIKYLGENI